MGQAMEAIEHATRLAESSGKALEDILVLCDRSSNEVRSIAAAAEQQSAAALELNHSVAEIDRISAGASETMAQSSQAVAEPARQAQ